MALAALALLLIPLPMAANPEVEGFASPAGFQDDLVATIQEPVSLEVIPSGADQGAILVAQKEGQLWWLAPNSPDESLVVDLRSTTCDESERGLLGIALDPQFATNRFVYLYRTFEDGNTCRNRVSRFVLGNDRTIDPLTEQVLLQTSHLTYGNHNGGDIHIGADGNLYIAVGDNATGANAQRRDNLFGKILRITTSGTAPQDNPFMGAGSQSCAATGISDNQADCQEIYAFGLRNPFRFAFDPSGDRFWI
ncbi:MAG: PQQ-dependent sugar dehydrogenase, partial [Chloroflexota bacterium]